MEDDARAGLSAGLSIKGGGSSGHTAGGEVVTSKDLSCFLWSKNDHSFQFR